jgi:GntR family transcriptional regulator
VGGLIASITCYFKEFAFSNGGLIVLSSSTESEMPMRKVEVVLPLKLFSTLDRTDSAPLHSQLTKIIEAAILSGKMEPGDRFENEVALGERLGLSRPTIRRAISELVNQGLVVRRRGVGTQVVQGQITRGLELTSLFEDLRTAGLTPKTRMLEVSTVPATKLVAEKLGVQEGADVLYVHRLRFASGTPVAVMENWLNSEYAEPNHATLGTLGLYAALKERGIEIKIAKQNVGARKASSLEAELLEIEKNAPVLTMDRTGYDTSGHAIEYGHHCYRTDIYSLEFTLVSR